MNSLFQQLNPVNTNPQFSNLAGIKQMMNTMRMVSNPKQALQSMVQQNPQMKQVMDIVQQSGGDPRTAFYKLAQQKGVNPDDILNALR